MKATIVQEETKQQMFAIWSKTKNKAETARALGLCRKKVAQLIHLNQHQQIFDVDRQKNWLIND